jgi:hypothetical protein
MQATFKKDTTLALAAPPLGRLGLALALWPMTYGVLKLIAHVSAGDNDPATQVLTGPSSYMDWALGSFALAALFATALAASSLPKRAWPIAAISVATLALQTLLAP